MTLRRRLAVAISNRVTRWSSPGCKDWAEGLAREVDSIPSDWRALAWSLGSLRVVLNRREVPLASLAEVPGAAMRFVVQARNDFGALAFLVQAPMYLARLQHPQNTPERFACVLVILVMLAAVFDLLLENLRLKPVYKDDVYDDLKTCVPFYRQELARQRSRLWILTAALFFFCVGGRLSLRGDILVHPVVLDALFGFGCVVTCLLFRHARQTNLMRIERLDALLAEQTSAEAQ